MSTNADKLKKVISYKCYMVYFDCHSYGGDEGYAEPCDVFLVKNKKLANKVVKYLRKCAEEEDNPVIEQYGMRSDGDVSFHFKKELTEDPEEVVMTLKEAVGILTS